MRATSQQGHTAAGRALAAGPTRDLMARMGHDDMRAALIYQRATDDAERRIADDLSRMTKQYREGRTGE
ncbi:hypothetical protein [Nocardia grenadensis]